jgi:hypothetical protein
MKQFIQENDLGGSNFIPAKIYKNGKQIGFISYNGRVWNNDQSEMKYAQGGEMESEDMDVQFIEYKDNEIMYEPHYKKYYANDVEFNSLKDAQKFLDSGKMSNDTRGAYQRGLFAKGGKFKTGGNVEKPSWIAIYQKGNERKILEVNASSREEAKLEAEKDKKRYNIPQEMFLYDIYRKFANGGKVKSFFESTKQGLKKGYDKSKEYTKKKIHDTKKNIALEVLDSTKGKVPSTQKSQLKVAESIVEKKYAKGGEMGFQGLANKVAKRYVRKKVSKEYQAEYGKTYDAKEAQEVGNKVAGKVYQQQVAKKKIFRKLQRKTK